MVSNWAWCCILTAFRTGLILVTFYWFSEFWHNLYYLVKQGSFCIFNFQLKINEKECPQSLHDNSLRTRLYFQIQREIFTVEGVETYFLCYSLSFWVFVLTIKFCMKQPYWLPPDLSCALVLRYYHCLSIISKYSKRLSMYTCMYYDIYLVGIF